MDRVEKQNCSNNIVTSNVRWPTQDDLRVKLDLQPGVYFYS